MSEKKEEYEELECSEGRRIRGQIYVEQKVKKAYGEFATLRKYVRETKRLTKNEINTILDRMKPHLDDAMNTGEYSD